jgi:hypothetical protein
MSGSNAGLFKLLANFRVGVARIDQICVNIWLSGEKFSKTLFVFWIETVYKLLISLLNELILTRTSTNCVSHLKLNIVSNFRSSVFSRKNFIHVTVFVDNFIVVDFNVTNYNIFICVGIMQKYL